MTEVIRSNGTKTKISYDVENYITKIVNTCGSCGKVISTYEYKYNDQGYIVEENATELEAGTRKTPSWEDWYNWGGTQKETSKADCEHQEKETQTTRTYEYDDSWEFLCIDLDSEELQTVWSCEVPEKPSTAAVQGDNVIFAAGDSLYTHHYKNTSETVRIPVGKTITGSPFATEYAVFFSTEDGNAAKLRLNSDGTLEEDTLTFCRIGDSPSSPLSWNGRLYVAAADGFYVLDNLNMEVSYVLNDIKGGCTPQVHYGSGPYIYTVAPREDRWAVYCIRDMDDETEPTYAILAQMEDYSRGAFCASAAGTLYFLDAVGRVYALTIAPFDVLGLIIRLVVLLALMALVFIWFKKMADRRAALLPKY